MSKKNIDRLFQEKFSDFSDTPTEKVWKSIEASLNMKKKNRKVIPIWWRLGGIAAALAIGLFLFNPFHTASDAPEEKVTDVKDTKEEPLQPGKDINQSPFPNTPKVVEQSHQGNVGNDNTKKVDDANDHPTNNSSLQPASGNNGVLAAKDNLSQTLQTQDSKNTQFAASGKNPKKDLGEHNILNEQGSTKVLDHQVAKSDSSTKIPPTANSSENTLGNPGLKTNEEAIALAGDEDAEEKTGNTKKSIFDEIVAEEEEVATAKGSKWSAGPTIAPVYFNAMGNGSPVHSIFVPNSKSGDFNMSYGVAVSYEISPKLSVKTGINKVDYGYNTNDVEFSSTLEGFGNGQIANIAYNNASMNILVESTVSNTSSLTGKNAFDATAKNPSLSGVMAQQFGYLEIPVELNYALINNKFGVDLIGGVSSLFLVDNSVSLTSGELTTEMGEANNLNTVNFSTNVGFGLHYKFTPKVQLNIDPIFKYQLNTFSNTAGDFRPFTIGVYSGLNFKF